MFEGCLLVSVSRCFAAITQSQWWLSCHLVSAALTPHHSSDELRVTTVIIGMLPPAPGPGLCREIKLKCDTIKQFVWSWAPYNNFTGHHSEQLWPVGHCCVKYGSITSLDINL